jgi:hypothetical protein
MCRSDIKYFDYQGDNTRIVRVPSVSEGQRINQGMMSILQVRIKLYKFLTYFLILFNTYSILTLFNYEDAIKFYKSEYEICNNNLTLTMESNTDLRNHITEVSMRNDELLNMVPSNVIPFSLVNIIQDNRVFSCLFPEYYIDKCIG